MKICTINNAANFLYMTLVYLGKNLNKSIDIFPKLCE